MSFNAGNAGDAAQSPERADQALWQIYDPFGSYPAESVAAQDFQRVDSECTTAKVVGG